MSDKNPAARRFGGPGASHQNRQAPEKSEPHGTLDRDDARSGARAEQNRPYGEAKPFEVERERGHAEAGATRGKEHMAPSPDRSISNSGDTAADTEAVKSRERKQER